MDNKQVTDLAAGPLTDLSPLDLEKVQAFTDAGLPGLFQLTEAQVERITDLYLSGKPYVQISRILKVDKTLIMYMSKKFNWYVARMEYLHELESTIRNRLVESKIVSQDFLLQLTHMYQKKIGKKVSSYLQTNDDSHAESIDPKDVDKVIKIMDMLHKISSDGPVAGKPAVPSVGLNLGEGVTINKNEDGSVEITPKQKSVGDLLKQFANLRRENEQKNEEK